MPEGPSATQREVGASKVAGAGDAAGATAASHHSTNVPFGAIAAGILAAALGVGALLRVRARARPN
jgi:hypothetical protein